MIVKSFGKRFPIFKNKSVRFNAVWMGVDALNIAALRTEIIRAEYNGMSDAAIATAINAKMVTRNRLTPTWEVKKHAIENGYWPVIVIAAEASNSNQTVRGLAISAKDWIDDVGGKIQSIDFSLTSAQTLVGGLVAATLITESQGNALLALGSETVRWTVTIGLAGDVTSNDVNTLRNQ
jgi:hypothetical protein